MSDIILNDATIRDALHKTVLMTHTLPDDRRVVNELVIESYTESKGGYYPTDRVVADIAKIGFKDGQPILSGIEIKGETDTLKRLPKQIKIYDELFIDNAVVLTENHYEKARKIIPWTWEVAIAKVVDNKVCIEIKHNGRFNHNRRMRTALEMLWSVEIMKELRQHGVKAKDADGKYPRIDLMCKMFGETHITEFVIKTLLARENWKQSHWEINDEN